jgi:hypothetical protein
MTLRLTRADLLAIDLERLRPYAAGEAFFAPHEHYRLLAHLSTRVGAGATIFDIGTHLGDSALALAYGGADVESFDIVDNVQGRKLPPNIRRHLTNLWTDQGRSEWRARLLASPLIFLDIDPHEGTRELEFVRWLEKEDYQGTLVLDDIWHFKGMRDNLWSPIEGRYKTDVTALGHWSGTGIVRFHDRAMVEDEPDTANWTLVTGYFDLTKKPDANAAIRARPMTHYLDDHAQGTLGLDQNLVIYCDPNLEAKVWSIRPAHLHARTRVVPCNFEALPLTQYRPRIIANRGGRGECARDPRNTASYYLFCMARYAMLKRTIADNPFQSTHFAWTNICIERMGAHNLARLSEALGVQREKFSTCFIDYVAKAVALDLPRYFGLHGCASGCAAACTMCSGFFTGDARHMRAVCDRLEEEFVRCLQAGVGHADEQLYPLVYYQEPELFDWYVGDYAEMVTNYAHVYERAEQPVRNLIRNSLAAGDLAVARRAAKLVRESYRLGKCTLEPDALGMLVAAEHACAT